MRVKCAPRPLPFAYECSSGRCVRLAAPWPIDDEEHPVRTRPLWTAPAVDYTAALRQPIVTMPDFHTFMKRLRIMPSLRRDEPLDETDVAPAPVVGLPADVAAAQRLANMLITASPMFVGSDLEWIVSSWKQAPAGLVLFCKRMVDLLIAAAPARLGKKKDEVGMHDTTPFLLFVDAHVTAGEPMMALSELLTMLEADPVLAKAGAGPRVC